MSWGTRHVFLFWGVFRSRVKVWNFRCFLDENGTANWLKRVCRRRERADLAVDLKLFFVDTAGGRTLWKEGTEERQNWIQLEHKLRNLLVHYHSFTTNGSEEKQTLVTWCAFTPTHLSGGVLIHRWLDLCFCDPLFTLSYLSNKHTQ